MKRFLLYSVATLFLSCGGTQKATNLISTGNYVNAFNISLDKLRKDKTSKANQKHIPILKEAYIKAKEADIKEANMLVSDFTIPNFKKVYGIYLNVDIRQDEVKALVPLYVEGNEVHFDFYDYSEEITGAKNAYSKLLYDKALIDMKGDKIAARNAYKNLEELIYVNPTYKRNLTELSQKAKNKGSSFVLVSLKNNIRTISNDSIADFTRLNTGNFNDQWVAYHHKRDRRIKYDYQIAITFDKLALDPEKTQQQTVPQEAKVQDGWQYQLDSNGNVMKDDKGNDLKVAKYILVKADIALFQQQKASKIDGTIVIKKLKNNTIVSNNPMFGEAKFEHTYGKFRGDQRAIEQKYFDVLKAKEIPYPKDYLFVKYSVLNFKQKLTNLLSEQQF